VIVLCVGCEGNLIVKVVVPSTMSGERAKLGAARLGRFPIVKHNAEPKESWLLIYVAESANFGVAWMQEFSTASMGFHTVKRTA
jgi:hypothetical protein